MRFLCLATFAALLCLASAAKVDQANVPADIAKGFFHGRSGSVILKSSETKSKDVEVIMNSEKYVSNTGASISMPATAFSDVIARVLSVEPLGTTESSFLSSSVLDRPAANIMVAVESLSLAQLTKYQATNLQALQSSSHSQQLVLNYESYPDDPISIATTLSTGVYPNKHGIVSKAWQSNGENVKAFGGADSLSKTANIADVLSQTYPGQALVVSYSGNDQHSAAHGLHPSLAALYPHWPAFVSNSSSTSIDSASDAALVMTEQRSTLREHIADSSKSFLALGHAGTLSGHTLTVSLDGKQSVAFDLDNEVDSALPIELQYAYELHTKLSEASINSLVADSIPDHYAITIASLTALSEKYGHESAEFNAGVHLIDATVPHILTLLANDYKLAKKEVVSEVVLLGSHQSVDSTVDTRAVFAQIEQALPQTKAKAYFPALYVESASEPICQTLNDGLGESQFAAYCPGAHLKVASVHLMSSTFTDYGNYTNGTYYNVSTAEIASYQIVLWVSIALAFAVAAAVYSLAFMSFKKDTLLYGSFNPNWESAKRH